MIYIVLRQVEDTHIKECCIVKAKSHEQAKKMVGVDVRSTEWAGFGTDEITAMSNAKEGYIAKDM